VRPSGPSSSGPNRQLGVRPKMAKTFTSYEPPSGC
jgi:hypothetical protein